MTDIRKIGDSYVRHRSRLTGKKDGRFGSGKLHPKFNERDAWLKELKAGSPYGSWEVVGNAVITGERSRTSVLCRCNVSGIEQEVSVDNLTSGKSRGPRGITNKISRNSKVLGERYDAMKQRCENPSASYYRNYGGRGIKNRFTSRKTFRPLP